MDFTFTEDQRLLRDTMRSFFMIEATPELTRELWETETGRSDVLWQKFAEQGLTGLSVPEACGGMGCGDLEWVLMAQEAGYYALQDSLIDTAYLAVSVLRELPSEHPLALEWLPRIAQGTARVALVAPGQTLSADAHIAELLLMAHEGELHAVPSERVALSYNASLDPSRRLYRVDWIRHDDTRVLDAKAGAAVWRKVALRGALASAAQLLGLTQRMLDLSIDYTAQRKQFGKAIGSFQAVKHHLADVAVKQEFARPVVARAAYAIANDDPLAELHVSHARLAAGEAAWLAAKRGIQVHGAMGYTWEMDLQIFMKRAWVLDAAWGDRAHHKQCVARAILADDARLGPGETFANACAAA